MSTQLHQPSEVSRPLPPPDLTGFEIAPVTNSSFIALFAFHHELNILHVEFQSGHCARYKADVGLFREWKAAESIGKFFHARVRSKLEIIETEAATPPIVAQEETAEVSIEEATVIEDAPSAGEETPAVELSAEEEQLTEVETKLATQSDELYLQAARVEDICDRQSYDLAADLFGAVLAMEAEIKKEYGDMKAAAYAAHRKICEKEKARLEPITIAKHRLSALMGAYDAEQRRLKEEADRKARLDAEQQSREQALQAAAEAEEQGAEPEEVEMILNTPAPVPIASRRLPAYAPKFASRQKWMPFLEGTERAALLKVIEAAHANPDAFADCLQLNMSEIKRRADKQKGALKVPGFYARPETKATAKSLKNGGK